MGHGCRSVFQETDSEASTAFGKQFPGERNHETLSLLSVLLSFCSRRNSLMRGNHGWYPGDYVSRNGLPPWLPPRRNQAAARRPDGGGRTRPSWPVS
jgi:hypothetical protein